MIEIDTEDPNKIKEIGEELNNNSSVVQWHDMGP